ncbi:MAG: BON domain-containing protein [Telmatospirillum sp.]|nr:BON domain-containing protein [Telmatospirillum sp.]
MRKVSFPAAAAMLALGLSLQGCVGAAIGGAATVGSAAMQDRGLRGAVTDNAIAIEINHYWFQKSEKLFAAVQTQIYEGRVLVSGAVTDPDMRAEAIRLAWQAKGVREIINEIEITDEGGLKAYAKDTWSAGELRSRLLFARGVNSSNYSVEVVNGTVYLLGVFTDAAEHDRVLAIARSQSNIRRVVSHVIARDDPRRFRSPPGEETGTRS